MKRAINEYLKTLLLAKDRGAEKQDRSADMHGTLEINPDGYPVAPRTQSWRKVTKADIEPLYRMYITQHYRTFRYFPLIRGNDTYIHRIGLPRSKSAGTIRTYQPQSVTIYCRRVHAEWPGIQGSSINETRFNNQVL